MSPSEHSTRPDRRPQVLARRKSLKIARSANDFVRASIQQFYTWLDRSKATAQIPLGPTIWICVDCHTANLGPVADKYGRVSIQIRDLDQT